MSAFVNVKKRFKSDDLVKILQDKADTNFFLISNFEKDVRTRDSQRYSLYHIFIHKILYFCSSISKQETSFCKHFFQKTNNNENQY